VYHISKIDRAATQIPSIYQDYSSGFTRATYVDRNTVSVHMGTSVCFLEPRGSISIHLHPSKRAFISWKERLWDGSIRCLIRSGREISV